MVRATKSRNAIRIEEVEEQVERLARQYAAAVASSPMPSPVFRGVVPSRYGPLERWGSGSFEVWCIRTGFDLRHRRFYRDQWCQHMLQLQLRDLRAGPLYDRVRERAEALLRPTSSRRTSRAARS